MKRNAVMMSDPFQPQQFKSSDPRLPMMNDFLLFSLTENTNLILRALSRFGYAAFNQGAPSGRWSGGDIAEHLLLVDIQVEKLLHGKSALAQRDSQDKIEEIKNRLLDRTITIEAPSKLKPTGTAKDPTSFAAKIVTQRRNLTETIMKLNLNDEYPETPNRLFGVLSGIEWVNFLIYHGRRHVEQLNLLPGDK